MPDATRPLLRQIESLQASAAEKQRVWEQLEQQLRQRCAQAEAEARGATQREAITLERLGHQQQGAEATEMRIASLQSEVSRLGAEHKGARDELAAVERAERDTAAELVVVRATADRRAQEIADLKAAHREAQEQEAQKMQQERDRINDEKAVLQRQVRGLEVRSCAVYACRTCAV